MARRFMLLLVPLCFATPAVAAPMLRLTNTVVGPLVLAVGAPSSTQTLEAYNIGDGALVLTVKVAPSITWLTASAGAAGACSTVSRGSCIPLRFMLNTAGLAGGTYTAGVTVEDPHAIDSPQVVTVTVHVGNTELSAVDELMSPGATRDIYFSPGVGSGCLSCGPSVTASTRDGGIWLSVVVDAF